MRDTYSVILEHFESKIAGQASAKHDLAILGALYVQRSLMIMKKETGPLPRLNTFLGGRTGSGKTYLCETLAECLEIPFLRVDCSNLSQTGWSGISIMDHLSMWAKVLDEDGFGILLLDEMDKLGNHVISNKGGVPSLGIQYNLLDLVDGKIITPELKPNFQNTLILCAGAFSSVTTEMDSKKHIGFHPEPKDTTISDWREILIEGGLIPELVGRFSRVIEIVQLTKPEIKEILLRKNESAYAKYLRLLPSLCITEEDIDAMVDKVYNNKYGLRELDTIVYEHVINNFKT